MHRERGVRENPHPQQIVGNGTTRAYRFRMRLSVLPAFVLVSALCACALSSEDEPQSDDAVTDADLTQATATRLGVPLAVLEASFFFKPSSIDQSGLGVVLGERAAFASGSGSQSLPAMTTLDHKPFARLFGSGVDLGPEAYFGAFFDYPSIKQDGNPGERLVGKHAAPLLPVTAMAKGKRCRVLGAAFDMYSSAAPKLMSLAATIDSVSPTLQNGAVVSYTVVAKTRTSTGGEGSLLVCDGKLAGISAGAGSQGTYFEFHSVDPGLVKAFERARDGGVAECKRRNRCD